MASLSVVDRVLYNGTIVTLNNAQPRVPAVAIHDDKIVAAGADEDILALAGHNTHRENLNGAFVVPGMTDAHVHWQAYSQSLTSVFLYNLKNKQEALQRVADRAAQTPYGEWIIGYGWSQDEWDDKHFPTAADLDSVAPNHPVFLKSRSVHAGWVNSAALRLCGIDASTHAPDGGEILMGDDGQPTGILLEWGAMGLIEERIPIPTLEQIAEKMLAAQEVGLSLGMTGFHDFDNQECFAALQLLRERGQLELRVLKNFNKKYLDSALDMGLRFGFGDDWIRLGALKIFADGALGPHTACMIEPYEGEPENHGIIVTEKEDMMELASRASASGFPTTIHAIGDRAVHDVLDVFDQVRSEETGRGEAPNLRRHRVEHVQLIHPSDVSRLAELNLVASMQPIHATADYQMADQFWGAKRVPYSYNPRLQLDRGVTLAFGSDAPVDALGPLAGIHAAVTRRRADGSPSPDGWQPAAKISVDEALRGYTIGAAYAAGMEDKSGQIRERFLADIVVLDRDIFTLPPDELLETRVLATMVGGEWRFGGYE
jgi:hypothetical protein